MFRTSMLFRLAAIAAIAWAASAAAQPAWPDKPIRLIVPNAPGSSVDVLARVIADKMKASLNQSVVVENRPGAAGVPGTEAIVRAPKDGYTLGLVASNHVINPAVYKTLPYDAIKDVTPIEIIGTTPMVLVSLPTFPVNTVSELVAKARASPGAIMYGSAGNGSVIHLAGEMLRSGAKIDVQHVPYKGGNELMMGVLGDQVQIAFLAVATVLPQIQAGKLKPIAVSVARRVPSLPDVPTVAESGVPDYTIDAWLALIGPAGLPTEIVDRLNRTVSVLLADPGVREAMAKNGIEPVGSTPAQARELFERDLVKFTRLAREAGLSLD